MILPLLLLIVCTARHHGTGAEFPPAEYKGCKGTWTLRAPQCRRATGCGPNAIVNPFDTCLAWKPYERTEAPCAGNTYENMVDWGARDPKHEKVVRVLTDGTLKSPDFPHAYPRNKVLVWRLVAASENTRIQVTFDERFGLEEPEDGICKYDFVEIEEPAEGTVLGRWCGSQRPGRQLSKGNQIRIRFVSDQYLPSKPGFCIHYSLVPMSMDVLTTAMSGFSTVEDVMKYLEPDRWQLDMENLYKPTWHALGKTFLHPKKSRGTVDLNALREEVRLYSCTPRNFSVSLREELRRTDAIFWPGCLLVKRCGGNCACCAYGCHDCQCSPTKVTKKYHEVLQLKLRSGGRGLQKSLTDVHLEHHEECSCVCKDSSRG